VSIVVLLYEYSLKQGQITAAADEWGLRMERVV